MSGLPLGWERATVGALAEVVSGPAFKSALFSQQGSGVPLLRGENIEPGRLRWREKRTWPPELLPGHEHLLVEEGDSILAMDRPVISTGLKLARVKRSDLPALLVQRVARIRVRDTDVSSFVALLLQHPDFVTHLLKGQVGTQLPHVTLRDIAEYPVLLPPLGELKRLVGVVEETLSKLDAGDVSLQKVRHQLKLMRASVLAAAIAGRLVRQVSSEGSARDFVFGSDKGSDEHNETCVLPVSWTSVEIGQLATVGTGTTPSRSNARFWEGGSIPWVTSALLSEGVIQTTNERVTPVALRDTPLKLWPVGTLLVAMYGEGKTRGTCAELAIDATCNQACAAIVLPDSLQSMRRYLKVFFDASYESNRRLASGGVQPNLNLGLVKAIKVSVPPPGEQQRIVEEVERQFSFIKAIELAVDGALARSAALRRSILKAAFEGKLVPQDPTDEPASVLLERIRAERLAFESTLPKKMRTKVTK
jgi:type I restriction enzyme, S subunit